MGAQSMFGTLMPVSAGLPMGRLKEVPLPFLVVGWSSRPLLTLSLAGGDSEGWTR